jgi:hypothetical protein
MTLRPQGLGLHHPEANQGHFGFCFRDALDDQAHHGLYLAFLGHGQGHALEGFGLHAATWPQGLAIESEISRFFTRFRHPA